MTTIKIMFEWNGFPIWLYREEKALPENDLPPELIGDEIEAKFAALQEKYNLLFIDDEIEFRYKGFENEKAREAFVTELRNAIDCLKHKIGDGYTIDENCIL